MINATSSRRYFFFTQPKFDANNELFKENLVKYKGKRTIQTGRLFFSSSLISKISKVQLVFASIRKNIHSK